LNEFGAKVIIKKGSANKTDYATCNAAEDQMINKAFSIIQNNLPLSIVDKFYEKNRSGDEFSTPGFSISKSEDVLNILYISKVRFRNCKKGIVKQSLEKRIEFLEKYENKDHFWSACIAANDKHILFDINIESGEFIACEYSR